MTDRKRLGDNDYPIGTTWPQQRDESAPIYECTCPLGRTIVLTAEAWGHILAGHPEMEGKLAFVEWCLARAEFINSDKNHPRRDCYYVSHRTSKDRPVWIKVVVHFDKTFADTYEAEGFVATAYIVSRIPRKEVRKWP